MKRQNSSKKRKCACKGDVILVWPDGTKLYIGSSCDAHPDRLFRDEQRYKEAAKTWKIKSIFVDTKRS